MAARPPSDAAGHGAATPGPASLWQRSAAWSLDAALVAPLAGLLAWPWLATPVRAWIDQVRALLQHTGQAMGAAIVDGVPLPQLAMALSHDAVLQQGIAATGTASWAVAWPVLLAFALVGGIYHVAGECSPWRASAGKRMLGLRACDRDGRRLGIGRAAARHCSGALSWATLNLGHLMAAMAPDHLALHDRCSRTRVLSARGAAAGLPAWAWAWLGLLALAGIGATAWLADAATAIMRAALEQALS